jgi:hypothetical protein
MPMPADVTAREAGQPITAFYCQHSGGLPVAVIVEVHHTDASFHRYVLRLDENDPRRTDSSQTGPSLLLSVSLHRREEPPLGESVTQAQVPVSVRNVAAALAVGTALLTKSRLRGPSAPPACA